MAPPHPITVVGHDIQFSAEAVVKTVGWTEEEMHTGLLLHQHRVDDEIVIEADGPVGYGRQQSVLQQPDILVVDIHIGKEVAHGVIEQVTTSKQIANA